MKLRRAITALGTVFALSFGLMLAPSQADAATLTINPRANAVEAGQVLAAPDGSIFTITVYDAGLEAGQKSVTHTFQTGDTLRQTANKIVQAINADTELQAIGVTAALQNGANYTIASTSSNGTLYKQTTTGGGSNRLAIQQTLTIGGTVTVGDKVTLNIYDAGLVGGKEVVAYKPVAGDTIATIVTKLRNKINNSTTLEALGISAKISSTDVNVLLIESATFDATETLTTYSAKVSAGATETVALAASWGTNGAQTVSVTGPVTVGETVKFTVFNPDLPDSQKEVSYVTQAGDNLNKIRCGLRTEVNNDLDLSEIGIHATCGGGVLTLTSTSNTPMSYWTEVIAVCKPVDTAPLNWPPANQVKYCGHGTSYPSFALALRLRETVEALTNSSTTPGGQEAQDAASKLRADTTTAWYLYANHDDYYVSGDSFFRKTGGPNAFAIKVPVVADLPTVPYVLGATAYGALRYSAVFEMTTDRYAPGGPVLLNLYVKHATAHETGHQLDSLYAGGSGISTFADTQAFKTALQRDIDGMNAMQACRYNATDGYGVKNDPPERSSGIWAASEDFDNTKPVDHGGLPGLFTGVQDSTGAEICNDRTPNIGGSNNFERAKIAFPYLERIKGKAGEPLLQTRELFAEEYAVLVQFPDTVDNSGGTINGSDNIFNTGAFVCTKLYVRTLSQEGRLPTGDELKNTGYSVPDIVPAGDPDAGAFGFGERLHACDGTIGELQHYGFGQ